MKKKFILVVSLILSLSLLGACSKKTGNSLEDIEKKGVLTIGTSADYPPYEFHALIDGKDEIVGFDIELAKYIAEDLGVELEIKEMDFKNILSSLSVGMIDLGIASISPKEGREANFSDIYYKASHGIIVTKDNPANIVSEEDLKGKNLGVQMGSVQEEIGEEIEGANLTSLALINDLIMELKINKIDGVIMEKPVAESYAKSNPDLMVVESIEITDQEGGAAIAIKKGNDELTKRINEIIKDVQEKNLLEKWIIEANEIQENN